ncbi:hypothetical protein ALC53_00095 [Atta colombica]|uniref:Uncharacterized protein n=1 Tax=Atta colombica TaxID=520822 RepID=A0A195BXZ1_9HYME|nr:hypothetical protein ALC53_00095 [Atta colombica]
MSVTFYVTSNGDDGIDTSLGIPLFPIRKGTAIDDTNHDHLVISFKYEQPIATRAEYDSVYSAYGSLDDRDNRDDGRRRRQYDDGDGADVSDGQSTSFITTRPRRRDSRRVDFLRHARRASPRVTHPPCAARNARMGLMLLWTPPSQYVTSNSTRSRVPRLPRFLNYLREIHEIVVADLRPRSLLVNEP